MSKNFVRECCLQLDLTLKSLYSDEYLRLPTEEDLKNMPIYIRLFMELMACLVL
jgi:hypothetical protein